MGVELIEGEEFIVVAEGSGELDGQDFVAAKLKKKRRPVLPKVKRLRGPASVIVAYLSATRLKARKRAEKAGSHSLLVIHSSIGTKECEYAPAEVSFIVTPPSKIRTHPLINSL